MFDGIYPPLPTPFANEEIDYAKVIFNIDRFNKTKLRGYVVLGSNGESVFLTREEKVQLVKVSSETASGDKIIIAGTGSDSIKETIKLTNECAKAGAKAALVLTPSYYKSQMNHAAMVKYFTAVADNSDIPVFIYNVPKFTGIDILPSTVAELAAHKNIIGIKDSTENIVHIMELIKEVPEDFIVFTGTGSVLYPAISAGSRGGIVALANVVPDRCAAIQTLIMEGKLSEAMAIQNSLLELNKAVTAIYGVAGLKKAMDIAGYAGGEVRTPLAPLPDKDLSDLKKIVMDALENS